MSISIRSKDLNRLLAGLDNAATIIGRAGYRAINKVARKYNTHSLRAIVGKIALSRAYVQSRMSLSLATATNQVAVISARRRPTTLARFNSKQLTRSAPNAKGDALRNISAGRKQAGISVKVKRDGSRKQMRGAFFIPLNAGKDEGGNGMGVFIREGKGKKDFRHLYGPSVDQLFRGMIPELEPVIGQELRDALEKQTRFELTKAIGRL